MHSPGHASNHHLVVTSYALQAPPPYSQHAHHPPALSAHSPHPSTTLTSDLHPSHPPHPHHPHHHHAHNHNPHPPHHTFTPTAHFSAPNSFPPPPGAYPYQSDDPRSSGSSGIQILPTFGGVANKREAVHPGHWGLAHSYPDMTQYNANPVGALQERYQSRGILPEYQVVQAEGASHCPTFAYQVIVDGKVAMGSGSSKKQAKHNAARSMLDKLDGRVPVQDFVQPLPPVSSSVGQGVMLSGKGNTVVPGAPIDLINSAAGNSIGQLQELCVHKGLQMPMYDVKAEEGQPHQRSFHMIVRVGSLSAEGEGASKKDAKREAAVKMISRVNEYLAIHPELDGDIKPLEAQIASVKTEPSDSSKSATSGLENKIKTLTPKDSKEIQSFYKDLSDEPGSLLHKLQTLSLKPLKCGYVSQLEALAKEQKFEVTFVEIEDTTDEGDTQCLVQLSSLPVAVALGLGPDSERAKEQAARNGLIYLKMMTSKSTEQSKAESSETKTKTTTMTPAPTKKVTKD